MVLKAVRIAISIVLVLAASMNASCEKEMLVFVKCGECKLAEPESATIKVKVRFSPYEINDIRVNVYDGDNRDRGPIITYIPTGEVTTVDIALNRTYTFEAVYSIGGTVYRCIDAVRPAVKYTEDDCDEPCYYVYNNKANLVLKYL